jgi:type IV secretory pathway TrbD component
MVVKKTDSWLLQLPVLLIAIGLLNAAAGFTTSDWACGTFNVGFMVSVSVQRITNKVDMVTI